MSEKKRKRIALGSTLFFHLVLICLCFLFRIGYSADKEKEDFSDIIYFSSLSSLNNVKSEIEKQEYQEDLDQEDLDQEDLDQEDLIDDTPQIDPRIEDLFNSSNDNKNDVIGCTDPEADNYDSKANIDNGSCMYEISNPGGAQIFTNGRREKLQGGDLKYNCKTENTTVIYELTVTIKRDGSVRVDKCEDKNGNGSICFQEDAIYAAETIKFSSLDKNDDSLGNIGKIIYTFSPE